jgi:hypothetical protein
VVLAARGADRKTAADGIRAVIDESGLLETTRCANCPVVPLGFAFTATRLILPPPRYLQTNPCHHMAAIRSEFGVVG